MPKVKICGIRRVRHALAAWEAGADFIGLMFAPSKRRITVDEGVRIVGAVKDRRPMEHQECGVRRRGSEPVRPVERTRETVTRMPELVGVFVNQSYDEIMRAVESCRLDVAQLHGDETPELCRRLPVPVIKAVRPMHADSVASCQEYVDAGARLLFDTYVSDAFGGSGVPGNWALAAELARHYPLLLAGGLDASNVAAAVRIVEPWGVDVSSGVETFGAKDLEKIAAFVRAVRSTE